MRHLAMAGDVPPVETVNLLGWLAGLATATVGAIGLWLAQRVLGKAAFQTAMNDGFAKLNDKLQVEMERREKVFAAERATFTAERIAWADEKAQLKGRIRQLEQQVEGLERRFGIEPSAGREPEPGATQL